MRVDLPARCTFQRHCAAFCGHTLGPLLAIVDAWATRVVGGTAATGKGGRLRAVDGAGRVRGGDGRDDCGPGQWLGGDRRYDGGPGVVETGDTMAILGPGRGRGGDRRADGGPGGGRCGDSREEGWRRWRHTGTLVGVRDRDGCDDGGGRHGCRGRVVGWRRSSVRFGGRTGKRRLRPSGEPERRWCSAARRRRWSCRVSPIVAETASHTPSPLPQWSGTPTNPRTAGRTHGHTASHDCPPVAVAMSPAQLSAATAPPLRHRRHSATPPPGLLAAVARQSGSAAAHGKTAGTPPSPPASAPSSTLPLTLCAHFPVTAMRHPTAPRRQR